MFGARFTTLCSMSLDILVAPRYIGCVDEAMSQPERTTTMTLAQIYADYTPGSPGFCIAVETHCGFCISREEIARIAEKADTATQFLAIWEGEDDWTDEHNQ